MNEKLKKLMEKKEAESAAQPALVRFVQLVSDQSGLIAKVEQVPNSLGTNITAPPWVAYSFR